MVSLRRGAGNNEDGTPIRPTLGPHPTAWDDEYPLTWVGEFLPLGEGDSEIPTDRFSITSISPHPLDRDEQALTREQYYELRG